MSGMKLDFTRFDVLIQSCVSVISLYMHGIGELSIYILITCPCNYPSIDAIGWLVLRAATAPHSFPSHAMIRFMETYD